MLGLCALLRPSPSPFGPTALHVLGALSGRNRRFLVTGIVDCPKYRSGEVGPRLNLCTGMSITLQTIVEQIEKALCVSSPAQSKPLANFSVRHAADLARGILCGLLLGDHKRRPRVFVSFRFRCRTIWSHYICSGSIRTWLAMLSSFSEMGMASYTSKKNEFAQCFCVPLFGHTLSTIVPSHACSGSTSPAISLSFYRAWLADFRVRPSSRLMYFSADTEADTNPN